MTKLFFFFMWKIQPFFLVLHVPCWTPEIIGDKKSFITENDAADRCYRFYLVASFFVS